MASADTSAITSAITVASVSPKMQVEARNNVSLHSFGTDSKFDESILSRFMSLVHQKCFTFGVARCVLGKSLWKVMSATLEDNFRYGISHF